MGGISCGIILSKRNRIVLSTELFRTPAHFYHVDSWLAFRESSESPVENTTWEQDYAKAKPVSRVIDQDVQMVDSPTTLKRVAEVQDAILEMNEDFKSSPQVKKKYFIMKLIK